MRESQVLEELEIFGSSQWGLVTAAQARRLGVERLWLSRMSARGMLQRVRHGVYALPSAHYGPLQDLQAAWLATDASLSAEERLKTEDPVVVSSVSAAGVHQLGNLLSARHEFSSSARRQTTQKDLIFHRCEVPARDITWVDGLPVTSVARTVGDLAANATDFDHLAGVVRNAVQDHHVKVSDLAERLFPHIDSYGATSGATLTQSLLDHAGYAPEKDPAVNKVWDELSQGFQDRLLDSDWYDTLQASIESSIDTRLAQINLGPIQDSAIGSAGPVVQHALRGIGNDSTVEDLLSPETVQGFVEAVAKIQPAGIKHALSGLPSLPKQGLAKFPERAVTTQNDSQPSAPEGAAQEEDDTNHDTLRDLPRVPVVAVENHLADKICAMYELHGRNKDEPSTRYRDLADIVRLVESSRIDAARLCGVLDHEQQRRGIVLPQHLRAPSPQWELSFPQAAKDFAEYPMVFHQLEASLNYAGSCLDSVLAGTIATGYWDPAAQVWKESGADT